MKTEIDSRLFDAETLRRAALKHMSAGPVTDDYTLDPDQACGLLNVALATEIMCVLRYRHHQIIAKGIHSLEVAAEFKEHAQEEEEHMMMIAERIDQLGGDPDFNPESVMKTAATQYGTGSHLVALIKENLIAERIAVETYRNMIKWFGPSDPTTRSMLEKILADEEEHASDLANLLVPENQSSGEHLI